MGRLEKQTSVIEGDSLLWNVVAFYEQLLLKWEPSPDTIY
jgi:hypothetical protein